MVLITSGNRTLEGRTRDVEVGMQDSRADLQECRMLEANVQLIREYRRE